MKRGAVLLGIGASASFWWGCRTLKDNDKGSNSNLHTVTFNSPQEVDYTLLNLIVNGKDVAPGPADLETYSMSELGFGQPFGPSDAFNRYVKIGSNGVLSRDLSVPSGGIVYVDGVGIKGKQLRYASRYCRNDMTVPSFQVKQDMKVVVAMCSLPVDAATNPSGGGPGVGDLEAFDVGVDTALFSTVNYNGQKVYALRNSERRLASVAPCQLVKSSEMSEDFFRQNIRPISQQLNDVLKKDIPAGTTPGLFSFMYYVGNSLIIPSNTYYIAEKNPVFGVAAGFYKPEDLSGQVFKGEKDPATNTLGRFAISEFLYMCGPT